MNPEKYWSTREQITFWSSSQNLRGKKTRLLCTEHGLQVVTDFRPLAKLAALACGCRRPVQKWDDASLREFENFRNTREHEQTTEVCND